MPKERFLKKVGGTRVFPYSDALVKRTDMVECDRSGKILGGVAKDSKETEEIIRKMQTLEADNVGLKNLTKRQEDKIIQYRQILEDAGLDLAVLDKDNEVVWIPRDPVAPENSQGGEVTHIEKKTGGQDDDDTGGEEMATVEQVVEAIAALDPANTEDFTETGLPRVGALEAVLDMNVDAALRDKAWAAYQEANK